MSRFKGLLCIVEPGTVCGPPLDRAVTLAQNNQASLTVMDVAPGVTAGIAMPDGGPISADLQAVVEDSHAQQLETLVEPYREQLRIETKVLVGTASWRSCARCCATGMLG